MIIELPKDFYYEKDGKFAFVNNDVLYFQEGISFERIMYSATYTLLGDKKCFYCGEDLTEENCTIDHIYPRDLGGVSITNNMVPCCIECNQKKNNMTYEEFNQFRKISPILRKKYKSIVASRHEQIRQEKGFYIPQNWYQSISDKIYAEFLLKEGFLQGKRYKYVEDFFEKYKHLPRPIVVSRERKLLDGFLTLFFAKTKQIEEIPCIILENVVEMT